MSKKKKKGPGRPRKYDSDAERKKAYRERKKEKIQKLESRAKRITELKGRIENMERRLVKSTYEEEKITPEYLKIHEQIKARLVKYTPFELAEMDLEQLKTIQTTLTSRYYGSYYNPLLAALETAIMPAVDREFDSRKVELKKTLEGKLKQKLAKPEDDVTPKTKQKVDKYIQKLKEEGVEITEEEEKTIRSTMEKRSDESRRHWQNIKEPYRTDQLIDVFNEMMTLFSVSAEIARRERESTLELNVSKLEKRLAELEKTLKDEKLREAKRSAERRKGKKDDS